MPERMSMEDFMKVHGRKVQGYGLFDGETNPETYQDLLDFMGRRLRIDNSMTTSKLADWIMKGEVSAESCSPQVDVCHAETVMLIGELKDSDRYVATLPAEFGAVVLPPPDFVRDMIAVQAPH